MATTNYLNTAADNDYGNAANWDNGLPGSGDDAVDNVGGATAGDINAATITLNASTGGGNLIASGLMTIAASIALTCNSISAGSWSLGPNVSLACTVGSGGTISLNATTFGTSGVPFYCSVNWDAASTTSGTSIYFEAGDVHFASGATVDGSLMNFPTTGTVTLDSGCTQINGPVYNGPWVGTDVTNAGSATFNGDVTYTYSGSYFAWGTNVAGNAMFSGKISLGSAVTISGNATLVGCYLTYYASYTGTLSLDGCFIESTQSYVGWPSVITLSGTNVFANSFASGGSLDLTGKTLHVVSGTTIVCGDNVTIGTCQFNVEPGAAGYSFVGSIPGETPLGGGTTNIICPRRLIMNRPGTHRSTRRPVINTINTTTINNVIARRRPVHVTVRPSIRRQQVIAVTNVVTQQNVIVAVRRMIA